MQIKKLVNDLKIHKLPIEAIIPDKSQPRQVFESHEISSLAEDIVERGLIHPIIVVENEEKSGQYILQDGERRWRASKQAGLDKIETIIMRVSQPIEAYELQFVASCKHKQPTIQEMAKAMERYAQEYKSIDSKAKGKDIIARLCKITGFSSTYFSQVQAILDISDPELRQMVDDRRVGGYFPAEVRSATKDPELRRGLVSGMKSIAKGGKKTTALIPRYIKHQLNDPAIEDMDEQSKIRYAHNALVKAAGFKAPNTVGNYEDYKLEIQVFGKQVEKMVMNGLTEDQALELSSIMRNIVGIFDSKRRTHFGRLNGSRK